MGPQTFHFLLSPTVTFLLNFQLLLSAIAFVTIFALWLAPGGLAWATSRPKTRYAIPGPTGFPLLGLLAVFTGSTPHRVLAEFASRLKVKSLMAFSVGFTRFVIASEPESAKEVLNSTAFADRPIKESAYELLFHRAMGFAPYGEYWRNLRRISSTYLFSPLRIGGFERFRREIGIDMVEKIKSLMELHGHVEVKKVLHFGSLNNTMMTVFGKRYNFDSANSDAVLLEELVSEGYELLGVFNWSDHFPVLGWLDLQGVRRRCKELVSKVNNFVGNIIYEHRTKRTNGIVDHENIGDFVDVLLDLENEGKLSHSDMIAVLWEMIFRGTDTVAILLEWILARMVLHPQIQIKVQAEIDSVVGNSGNILDVDIQNMPYLQAIVKETLRLHPPGPLLSWARLAVHDVHVAGHFVTAGTTAMVNMWAITHDESLWSEPENFKPERFLEQDVNIMGCDLRLAPFGSGRRVCPGKALGLATVHLWLAQLLHSFKFEGCSDIDMTEQLKLSMEMKKPLVCRAIPRVA